MGEQRGRAKPRAPRQGMLGGYSPSNKEPPALIVSRGTEPRPPAFVPHDIQTSRRRERTPQQADDEGRWPPKIGCRTSYRPARQAARRIRSRDAKACPPDERTSRSAPGRTVAERGSAGDKAERRGGAGRIAPRAEASTQSPHGPQRKAGPCAGVEAHRKRRSEKLTSVWSALRQPSPHHKAATKYSSRRSEPDSLLEPSCGSSPSRGVIIFQGPAVASHVKTAHPLRRAGIGVKLHEIQQKLKALKSQYNSFGKYYYRNAEDTLEAVKPLLGDSILTLSMRWSASAIIWDRAASM